jgi:general L-amino acid transport system permease protein
VTAPRQLPASRPRAKVDPGALLAQTAALGLVSALLVLIVVTTASNLQSRGILVGFQFLQDRAGFSIAESVLPYHPNDSNLWAMVVGIGNTLLLSTVVIVASTVIGAMLGIARLGANPLVGFLALVWIEGVRNTPPVLLLIFLYGLWATALPAAGVAELLPGVFASVRGLAIPRVSLAADPAVIGAGLFVSLALIAAARWAGRRSDVVGGRQRRYLGAAAVLVLVGWAFAGLLSPSFDLTLPRAAGQDLVGGLQLTPEFATVALGLTVYTAAFIAEIVRSGIESVSRGQWEAAQALGLTRPQALRLVIIPQMLRVIVPPMTSQFINTIKNSTLAIAIGYSDFMTIMGTVINRTNHAIEGTVLIVLVYLAINLALSAALDAFNQKIALRGRTA